MRIANLSFAFWLLMAGSLVAQSAAPELVGHWVAGNRSKGGIGSMWEFKKDGTLTMAPGAVVDMAYKVDGDKLILPPATTGPGAKPQVARIRFDQDAMYETSGDGAKALEQKFVRVSVAKPGDAPIVGTLSNC
ncbi:MAG: hypothetical protein JWO13_2346 [Acidobacteriales bacterium]|nr:hypothetical protein [Terriglobales bacterium]